MTLHTGLFMLEGGWESGKVRCMEDDGKGKEKKKKRGSCLSLILIIHLCLLFFLLLLFLLKCAHGASGGESKVSITQTCIFIHT